MTIQFKHAISGFVIIFFTILALSCATGKNATVSKEGGQIPPNFEPMKDSLLVIKNSMAGIGVGTTFRSAFKNYRGPYLMINQKDMLNYSSSNYKYVLYLTTNPSNFTTASGRPGPGTVSCIIEDRQTGKEYKSIGVPDFGRLLKNYVKKLNEMGN